MSRQGRLTLEHPAQSVREAVGISVLEEITGSPGSKRVEEVRIAPGDGQHHDRRLGNLLRDRLGRLDAAARHLDVDQTDIRPLPYSRFDSRGAVHRLGANLEPAPLEGESHANAS